MHVVIFHDQHPDTLGGAQLSVVLQAKYLRRMGHTVTICAPEVPAYPASPGVVTFAPYLVDKNNNYVFSWPSRKILDQLDVAFSRLPPVDIVHVQADLWGAILGFSFAKRHQLPTVMTFHTNVAAGNKATLRWLAKPFSILLSVWLKRLVDVPIGPRPTDEWGYLAKLAKLADVRIAPTKHFAKTLQSHGVLGEILAISNGLDDESVAAVSAPKVTHSRPSVVWTGRLTYEKRIMEFLEAVAMAGIDADVKIYGHGMLFPKAQKFIHQHHLEGSVHLEGTVSSSTMLQAIADADLLVQTSIGYETQGRTALEAIVLGTRVVSCDPKIVADYPPELYWVVEDSSVEALAQMMKIAVEKVIASPIEPDANIRERYLQSSLTRKLINVYKKLRLT